MSQDEVADGFIHNNGLYTDGNVLMVADTDG
jgi:hypothetical protein